MEPPFDAALTSAANGNFGSAVQQLKKITTTVPVFEERPFLTGVFHWALGEKAQARATWHTIPAGLEVAMSDEPATTMNKPYLAAHLMLDRSLGK